MRILLELSVIAIMALNFFGCQILKKNHGASESAVDQELVSQIPSQAPPPVAPQEPQKGFDQEAPRAQEI